MFQHQNSNKMVIVCRKGSWPLIKYLVGLNLGWHFFNRSLRPSFTLLGTKRPIGLLFSPAAASSSMVNSFFLTVLSWFRKLNSAAFFWSLANLFSYFDTFFNVGLMNFPLRSFTAMLSSLISKPLFLTSNSMSYF